jgi:hypothetical protein
VNKLEIYLKTLYGTTHCDACLHVVVPFVFVLQHAVPPAMSRFESHALATLAAVDRSSFVSTQAFFKEVRSFTSHAWAESDSTCRSLSRVNNLLVVQSGVPCKYTTGYCH